MQILKQNKILKSIKRKTSSGIVHIKATFNNTLVSVTDLRGNVISWSSSGSTGFKGSRKSTPFAAQTATNVAVKKAMEMGVRQVEINVSGPGSGRETAIRAIQALGLVISIIRDVTPIPHNGCRPTKKRRI
jgi:small subunit ribosomal protein S11